VGPETFDIDLPAAELDRYSVGPFVAGQRIKDFVMVRIKNFGQTPATNVAIWVDWLPMRKGFRLPLDFDFPDMKQLDEKGPLALITSNRLLFPGQSYVSNVPILDATPFIEANVGGVDMFVYGHIDYLDFYNAAERTTEFCYIYEPEGAPGNRFVAHDQHNEAT
jgi:hypothetical protein